MQQPINAYKTYNVIWFVCNWCYFIIQPKAIILWFENCINILFEWKYVLLVLDWKTLNFMKIQMYNFNLFFCFAVFRRSSNSTEDKGPISLEWIDFCFSKNGEKHRTDKYYCMTQMNPTLVVRRGLPFCFHLKFNRDFEKDKDNVSFMFKLAGNNQQFNIFNSIKYRL